jgi:hypothetical protein
MRHVLDTHYHLLPPIWGQDRCPVALCALYGQWRTLPIVGYHYHQGKSGVATTQAHQHGLQRFTANIEPTRQYIMSLPAPSLSPGP